MYEATAENGIVTRKTGTSDEVVKIWLFGSESDTARPDVVYAVCGKLMYADVGSKHVKQSRKGLFMKRPRVLKWPGHLH